MLLVVCQLSSDFIIGYEFVVNKKKMKTRNVIGQLIFHPSILSQLNSRLCQSNCGLSSHSLVISFA